MIQIQNATKLFDTVCAVDHITVEIPEGEIFGLAGTNGAGKSTLLRLMAGVLRPDEGSVLLDGSTVYENPEAKRQIFFLSDEAWFFPNATPKEEACFYQSLYPSFDMTRFLNMLRQFSLKDNQRIQTFSKGMKKQLMLILGLCTGCRYLLCDETFDGLDPVMRQAVKGLIANEMLDRSFTPVIASHNLREMEDICERIGLLHKGGLLLSRELEDMKRHIQRVQCVLPDKEKEEALLQSLDLLDQKKQGSLLMLTARGTKEKIMGQVEKASPVFCEVIPLSLEEIFISEMEVAGYEVKQNEQ